MPPPSRDWKEIISPDEAERFAKQVQLLSLLQADRNRFYRCPGRDFHRQQLLALRASFDVLPDLPEYARYGLFAAVGSHETWVRLSNGSFDLFPGPVPQVRGFAFKIFGVEGPDAREGIPARYQDFLMIQFNSFPVPSSWYFTINAFADGFQRQPLPADAKNNDPMSGFATTVFTTVLPMKVGPYAARARIVPPADQVPDPFAENDWGADMYRRLPVIYQFQLQFFVNETATPIEEPTATWSEQAAPWGTVAHRTIPQQDLDLEFAGRIEQLSFSNWNALEDHRPLGEINRARRWAMEHSVETRGGTYEP